MWVHGLLKVLFELCYVRVMDSLTAAAEGALADSKVFLLLLLLLFLRSTLGMRRRDREGIPMRIKAMGSNPARITWDSSRGIGVYRRTGGENMLLSLTDNV